MENLVQEQIYATKGKGRILCYNANKKTSNIFTLIKENKKQIDNLLLKYGGVLFRGFNIKTPDEFYKLSKTICSNLHDYVNRSTPRKSLRNKVYTSTEYPADQWIPFHNENSYTLSWPEKIIFFSIVVADKGGQTALADSRYVYDNINKEIIDKFNNKQILYIRNYIQGIDLKWQDVFQTDKKEEVEQYCRNNSISYEWKNNNITLTTKQKCQATIKHPITGHNIWFNQAHLFHISSINPDIRKILLQTFGKNALTRNSYYGDGTDIPEEYIKEIKNAYEKERIEFNWQEKDILILDNRLMAHSRNCFQGKRKVVVSMGSW